MLPQPSQPWPSLAGGSLGAHRGSITEGLLIRHIHWYVAAPGREDEGERALKKWVGLMASAEGFRGAEVLREDDHMRGVLGVIQMWDTADAAKAFNAANKRANPTLPDLPGPTPADQGAILFGSDHAHGDHGHDHGQAHGHAHGDEHGHDHGATGALSGLDFNRGGGLLARLLHGHFEVVGQLQP
jgi:hypothetical protein